MIASAVVWTGTKYLRTLYEYAGKLGKGVDPEYILIEQQVDLPQNYILIGYAAG